MLFILALSAVYYFYPEKKSTSSQLDSIKVKMSAIRRANFEKTLPKPSREIAFVEPESESLSEAPEPEIDENNEGAAPEEVLATGASIVPDIEGGWKQELKDLLTRLEPEEGESIYNAYSEEVDNYNAETESLQKEKDLATSDAALTKFDAILTEVDQEHDEKLKQILGPHFDEVTNAQHEYMSAVQHLTQEPAAKPVY